MSQSKIPELVCPAGSLPALKAAIDNGADVIYVGGEAFRPNRPWTLQDYAGIIAYAKGRTKVVINTPRTTMRRECGELEQFFTALNENDSLKADGIMVSNLGSLKLAKNLTQLPVQADISFNLFNHLAARFLKENGLTQAAASYELSFEQLREIVENSELPIEVIIHGSYESMICDHNIPAMSLPQFNELNDPEMLDRRYALLDKSQEKHAIRIDQFGHLLARGFYGSFCLPAKRMRTRRGVAEFFNQIRDHLLPHARINRRGCRIIQINRQS